jgi:hypothetical protein
MAAVCGCTRRVLPCWPRHGSHAAVAGGGLAVAVAVAFQAGAALMVRNLRGARSMPGVVAHGWTALAALAVVLASALSLAGTWLGLARRREITWRCTWCSPPTAS